jgi:hypothetical protein
MDLDQELENIPKGVFVLILIKMYSGQEVPHSRRILTVKKQFHMKISIFGL